MTLRKTCLLALLVVLPGTAGCASKTLDSPAPAPEVSIDDPTTSPAYVPPGGVPQTTAELLRELFVNLPTRLGDLISGTTPSSFVRRLEDNDFPDERRAGVAGLANRPFGLRPPYTTRYQQLAQYDEEPIVRATAVRALNRARDASARKIFTVKLADENVNVRLEACKALSNVPDPAAGPQLLRVFNNTEESADVRIAAAGALRHYRTLEVGRALVNVLNDRDFALAWQSRESLRRMTQADRGFDQAGWLNFLSGPTNPFG